MTRAFKPFRRKELLNNMIKANIARAVQEKASLTMKEATDSVELVIATLKETLAEGETVKFSGFW